MGYDNPLQNEYEGTPTTKHEPAARGEWLADDKYIMRDGVQIGSFISAELATTAVTNHNSHTALVEQRDRATQRVRELTDQLHALKTARREEQRLHEEMTWAAQAMADAVLQGNPGREMIVKLAEDLSKRLNDYYRARDKANAVERGDV